VDKNELQIVFDGAFWLSDADYSKAIGQLRLQMGGVFVPFKDYGQDIFVPSAREEAIKL